jgi:simple sugar transport system permease protein
LLASILTGAVRSGVSVLYATLGEIISERAGVVNLGVEGCMLMGACAGFVVEAITGNALLAIAAAAVAGGSLALIHAFLSITRGANQLASGLATMFFGLGLTGLLGAPYVKANITGLNTVSIPLLGDLPFVGPILFRHDLLTYLAMLLAPALWLMLTRTRWGLAIRAVGERPTVAFAAGLSPARVQYSAVIVGGMLAGLGGAQLSLAYTHTWVEGMTAGRGFIAVALVIFSMWDPLKALVGAGLFGGAVAFQFQLQSLGVPISPFILDMFPYVLTLLVLLVWGQTGKRAMPEGLKSVLAGGSQNPIAAGPVALRSATSAAE